MRLTREQIDLIKKTTAACIGPGARVRLFGSRVDDTARGGDIDLFVETDEAIDNRAQAICRLSGALTMALGDRKMDILLKDARTPETAVMKIAKRDGITL